VAALTRLAITAHIVRTIELPLATPSPRLPEVERIVASYQIDGHDLEVFEMVDEDVAWYQVAVDNVVLPVEVQPTHLPDENDARELLRRWLSSHPS